MNNEARKNSSREKIVSESLKLFSLKGFNNTSISDILAATKMSKGGFYNHFKSKEELFTAVLSEARRVWRLQNLADVDKEDREIDRLKKILANFRDRYLKDAVHFPGGCVFITLSVELDDQMPHLSSQLSDGFKRTKALLKGYLDRAKEKGEIRSDVSTSHVSEVIFSCILGASVVYGMDKSDSQLDRNIKALIHYLESIESGA
ncbi:MAG: HTH-type transcriptional repressor NemR [Syntrophaceae bacterium PtaU1.Bin231]|nr:MAG: HTH-type transcriptional repressor NemR [Syntrophaceae bacterium PtaU1.Bin231]